MKDLWSFCYHRGPAFKTAIVRASSEEKAWLVARTWCQSQGHRPPANVTPFIVADESILAGVVTSEMLPDLPDPVAATTGTPDFGKGRK